MVEFSVRSARRLTAFGLSKPMRPHVVIARAAEPAQGELKRTLLSPRTFRVVWWCVCGFHVFCGGFSLALGGVHALLATPDLYEYTSSSLQTAPAMLWGGAFAFLMLGFLHLFVIARMIHRSIRQRQLSFVRLKPRKSTESASRVASWRRRQLGVLAERRRRRSVLFHATAPPRALYRLWRRYFSIDGLYGLNGAHFDTAFTVREVVEMLSQLYQTYLLSISIVTPWVNQFAIAVVLINSISGLVIRLACNAMGTLGSTRHLITLIVDVALDFCSSMLIPVCILYEVVREFDWTTMRIPLSFLNSDTWLARRIAEVHQLIITSSLDLISMLALHVGVLGAMLTIASDLRRVQAHSNSRGSVGSVSSVSRISVVPRNHVLPSSVATTIVSWHRARWLVDLFFLACGVSAVAAHFRFLRDSSEAPFCLDHVDAWFVHKFPCAVVRINCHRFGANDSVVSILQSLDEKVLVSVSFAHCTDTPVEVPLALTAFRSIRQLKFINVSAISWAPELVIDRSNFPRLAYVLFGRTNMSSVPRALLHDRLPPVLREIEWSHSNLSSLPDDIGRVWATHEWFSIVLDHTRLTTLPSSFSLVRSRSLSLVDTRIQVLPEHAFGSFSTLRTLTVSGSPVASLPFSLVASGTLEQVLAECTQVVVVPEWLETWSADRDQDALSLYGSPVCETSRDLQRRCEKDHESPQGVTRWDLLEPFVPV